MRRSKGCGRRESLWPNPAPSASALDLQGIDVGSVIARQLFDSHRGKAPGGFRRSGRQRFGAATAGCRPANSWPSRWGLQPLNRGAENDGEERAEPPWREGKIKANQCLLPSVCLHVVFRNTFLEGVLSSPKVAGNSTLRPAQASWDLNVGLY
jgi:hypothetical protein